MKKYVFVLGALLGGVAFAANLNVVSISKNEAQALTKQKGAIKIASNAHSQDAAAMGIGFEWDSKQKDDCILTVAALADGTAYSFNLLIQSSGEYTLAHIPGPGVYEVAKGSHNINMIYIVNAKPITSKPDDPCAEVSCDAGEVCREGICVDPCADVSCGAGEVCREGICVDPCAEVSCDAGEACEEGICQPLSPFWPVLTHAQFSNDCKAIELLGEHRIQAPAFYASSTGAISTLCPGGVSGNEAGFRCALSNHPSNPFWPGEYTAHWTVEDSRGGISSAPAYAFQTVLTNMAPLFPMDRVMPSAVLGRDAMVGRQVLTSQLRDNTVGSPHPAGGCWAGAALRGSIAMLDDYVCALQAEGTVRCWELWTGAERRTELLENLSHVTAIAAILNQVCVLEAGGTVRCWELDSDEDKEAEDIPDNLSNVAAVVTGWYHTCALKDDGAISCWGRNLTGQLDVPPYLSAAAIAAGGYHSCALRANGTVLCWGNNSYGQTNVPEDLSEVVAIAAGGWHTCALQADGILRCWGDYFFGQLDIPEGLSEVVAVAAGETHTCALQAEGTVHCWGDSGYGYDQADVPEDLSAVVAIAAGLDHSCALEADGALRCWGVEDEDSQELIGSGVVQSLGQLVIQQ